MRQRWIVLAAALAAPAASQTPPTRQSVVVTEGTNMAAALAPDGRQIAIDLQGSLWVLPSSGGAAKRITELDLDARQPAWSPDGRRIAFQSYADGNWHIWTIAPDGSGLLQMTRGPHDDREPHWSPDGRRLVFSSDRSGNYDVWQLEVATGALEQITKDRANDFMPAWSPDGREVAFVSDRGGKPGIWAIRDGVERAIASPGGTLSAPAWHPDGTRVVFGAIQGNEARLMLGTETIASGEDVFPFRAQWVSATELLYTADGKIKRRTLGATGASIVEFSADLPLGARSYSIRRRAFPPTGTQPVQGIMRPVISPDGRGVAFAALGDLWLLPIEGGRPGRAERLTNDPFVETDPAWSPDGRTLAFVSDRAGTMDIWLREMSGGAERRLTDAAGAELLPAWSPDGQRLVYLNASGEMFLVDLTGATKKIHERLFDPGRPTWSADGRTIVTSVMRPYSSRYREGTNHVVAIPVDGGDDRIHAAVADRSAGAREDYGPVWSPDGSMMAYVEHGLWVVPVRADGAPSGPARRVTSRPANAPSWTADSRSVLVQTIGGFELIDVGAGRTTAVPVALGWTPKVVSGRTVVHAGRLIDMKSAAPRTGVDIVIEGNRVRQVADHRADLHAGRVVDASNGTVMPGLIEMHAHLAKAYGEALGRIWLSYGVTTVRNPAAHPFEGLEDREAVEAGARIGPRVYTTGGPFDGTRIYYAGGLSLENDAQLQVQLERTRALGLDFVKTYVRLPDGMQRRIVEFAHQHGLPVTSHEIYPAAAFGADGVEHIGGTSRRGYSPKTTALARTYGDVIAILAASQMTITPTVGIQGGFQYLTLRDGSWMDDRRITTLFPASVLTDPRAFLERERGSNIAPREIPVRHRAEVVRAVTRAGGRVVAGTDSPIIPFGLGLHSELELYVFGGLTPMEALRTATVNAAEALGAAADLGAVAPGMLADLVVLTGDPLADIRNTRTVRAVVKDGEVHELDALLRGPARRAGSASVVP